MWGWVLFFFFFVLVVFNYLKVKCSVKESTQWLLLKAVSEYSDSD